MFGMCNPKSSTHPHPPIPLYCLNFWSAGPLLASCGRCETQRRREIIVTELRFYLRGCSVSGEGETLLAHRARDSGAAAVMAADEPSL